jgi:hypothetical protein
MRISHFMQLKSIPHRLFFWRLRALSTRNSGGIHDIRILGDTVNRKNTGTDPLPRQRDLQEHLCD